MKLHTTFLITCLSCFSGYAAPNKTIINPDFTKGDSIPKEAQHTWNLGPTGMEGWMFCDKRVTSDARQVYLTKITQKSPAAKQLKVKDILLGVDGKKFSYDPRTEIGKAITKAEATDGTLNFIVWRDGKNLSLDIELPVLGSYSATAPANCKKSALILKQGYKALAEKMQGKTNLNPIDKSYNCLALLASGNKAYHSIVKKHIQVLANYKDPERKSLHSWNYGPISILIAEYTLATKDKSFLPQLERLCKDIAKGQSQVGSWGHKFVQPNGILSGYGMMNAPGVPLTIGLVLSRKAGVDFEGLDEAIQKNITLTEFYVDKGSIPYGDHAPNVQVHDDNGKNGSAAILFNLLENKKAAQYFSTMSVACRGSERDQGHTGNFFNILWAMPSVALSGQHATGAWLEDFGWYFDLARRHDGTFNFQGPAETRNTAYNNWDCTGVYLLAYASLQQHIHLTGKQKAVFPPMSQKLAKEIVADTVGWDLKHTTKSYQSRSNKELLSGLSHWSPVIRARSASILKDRKNLPLDEIVQLLKSESTNSQLGACQLLGLLRGKAAKAVPELQIKLDSEHLWVRIQAVEALNKINKPALPALPKMLSMIVAQQSKDDPRNMQQRYISSALFHPTYGMLRQNLKNVDKKLLNQAIIAGLTNQDGKARSDISSVFNKLSFEQIKELLPAIHEAVKNPAASGIMFADKVRINGLQILAKHQIKEGLDLWPEVIGSGRWGLAKRVLPVLSVLKHYKANASSQVPAIEKFIKELSNNPEWEKKFEAFKISELINTLKNDKNVPPLRSLKDIVK